MVIMVALPLFQEMVLALPQQEEVAAGVRATAMVKMEAAAGVVSQILGAVRRPQRFRVTVLVQLRQQSKLRLYRTVGLTEVQAVAH